MYSVDRFELVDDSLPGVADVTLDATIREPSTLLQRIADGLKFPDYFGGNWNALIDCLSDMTWSVAPEAIVYHASVPALSTVDLKHYLESLIDAVDRRTPNSEPKVRIIFRAADRQRLMEALAAAT